jgi:hypothetical protein
VNFSAVETARPLVIEDLVEGQGKEPVCVDVVDTPDRAIVVELADVGRGDVKSRERRKGPVEQPCGQSVVLGQVQSVPHEVFADTIAVGVLANVSREMLLVPAGGTTEARQAGLQTLPGKGHLTEDEAGPEPAKSLLPRALEEPLLEVHPAFDRHLVHGNPPAGRPDGPQLGKSDGDARSHSTRKVRARP